MAYAPHCDSSILHAPGECQFCDMYPLWQEYRDVAQIAFTGHDTSDGRSPCPSSYRRTPEQRDQWGGNILFPYPGGAQPSLFVIQEEDSITELR